MQISGFTFIRNAIKYDYPVVESITSILPVVDEFIVSVGNSDDQTLSMIQSISSPKIKIVESTWDDSLRSGGRVLAVETDKAFNHVSEKSDWAFYLQADEVVHEKYHQTIIKAANEYKDQLNVEGLLFNYLHFYGTYDYVGDTRRWYDKEIRMIRNDKNIRSYRDAQGFRKQDRKLKVKQIDAAIYHYGWVKHPQLQQYKRENFGKFWNDAEQTESDKKQQALFNYVNDADSLVKFNSTHPHTMQQRIKEKNWQINFDLSKKNIGFKDRFLYKIEKLTGKRIFNYKNYRII
jgi:hypothetical protein